MERGIERGPALPQGKQDTLPLRSVEEYLAMLDPEGALPKTVLGPEEHSYERDGYRFTTLNIFNASEKDIGSVILAESQNSPIAYIDLIELDDRYVGQGYGRAAYLKVIARCIAQGYRLRSGTTISRMAKPIWDWMVERGAARRVSDGLIDESRTNYGYSDAHYEIV